MRDLEEESQKPDSRRLTSKPEVRKQRQEKRNEPFKTSGCEEESQTRPAARGEGSVTAESALLLLCFRHKSNPSLLKC